MKKNLRELLLSGLAAVSVLSVLDAEAGGRVPTNYNRRYQVIFAEQELFRQRPELLACVYATRDYIQNTSSALFNKLNFSPKTVQSAYVEELPERGKDTRIIRMTGEGRVRAYSFLENWEPADIECRFAAGADPVVHLAVGTSDDAGSARPSAGVKAD